MHILHIDEQNEWRGGEQQASWLIQGLVARGHTVTIAARPDSAFLNADHGGVTIHREPVPLRSEFDLPSALRLARIVRERHVDILHAHTSHAHTLACLTRRIARRAKVVVHRRVSFPPKTHFLNRWKYREPDRIIAVSGKVDDVLREAGVPEGKRALVHSSIDVSRLQVAPASRTDLGVAEAVPLVVSAGALVGHKDHATLLAAMPAVLREIPAARLLLAGEGELRPKLESQITALDLASAVRLLGHRTDVPSIIRTADLYVSSSWSEGLGTSVLEALAAEVPVVATVAGGVPEMVLDGRTGYLVPNRNPEALAAAIIRSLQHRDHARKMARAGAQLVRDKFTVDRMVEGTIRVYESLLNGQVPA